MGRATLSNTLLRWVRGRGLWSLGMWTAGSGAGVGGGSTENPDTLVKKDKVVVFLKGTPEQPQCGFSNAVVQILRVLGVHDYMAYNMLDDPMDDHHLDWKEQPALELAPIWDAGTASCGFTCYATATTLYVFFFFLELFIP
uniref:Glutaredoxin domain-containing protein n=1 Tax=Oryctolagus cuniculus TaxID=9986 RepID=A0A5F9CR19_RABIT